MILGVFDQFTELFHEMDESLDIWIVRQAGRGALPPVLVPAIWCLSLRHQRIPVRAKAVV